MTKQKMTDLFVKGKKAALIALLTSLPLWQAKASVEHDCVTPAEQCVSDNEPEQKESENLRNSWLVWWAMGVAAGYGLAQMGKSKSEQKQR